MRVNFHPFLIVVFILLFGLLVTEQAVALELIKVDPAATLRKNYLDILLFSIGIGAILLILVLIGIWQLRKLVQKKTADLQKEILIRKSAEQRLELAIESAGLGIWDWDLETGKFNYDPKWIRMLAYDPEVFSKSTDWIDMVHPEDQANVGEQMREIRAGKVLSNNMAHRIRTEQNQWKWVLSFNKVVNSCDKTGIALNITGTHLDIDFIKRKETELHDLTKELRKSNSELKKFTYITSHNLRAPVVNLMSLTEMQADETLESDMRKEIEEKIHSSVKQLDSTLNDLIEIVASKSGDHLQKEALDLETELNVVLKSIENQVSNSQAIIETNFADCRKVNFSRHSLHSIFLNLLTNALKYKSNDKRLIISLKTRPGRDHDILYFSDNGLGIDLDKFGHKIFGLYQRFHTKIEGKGLGLYIVKSQIEAMDGKIEVDSIPDMGTTFRIYFSK